MNVCADFWDMCSVPFVLASTCMQLHVGICMCVFGCVWALVCVHVCGARRQLQMPVFRTIHLLAVFVVGGVLLRRSHTSLELAK